MDTLVLDSTNYIYDIPLKFNKSVSTIILKGFREKYISCIIENHENSNTIVIFNGFTNGYFKSIPFFDNINIEFTDCNIYELTLNISGQYCLFNSISDGVFRFYKERNDITTDDFIQITKETDNINYTYQKYIVASIIDLRDINVKLIELRDYVSKIIIPTQNTTINIHKNNIFIHKQSIISNLILNFLGSNILHMNHDSLEYCNVDIFCDKCIIENLDIDFYDKLDKCKIVIRNSFISKIEYSGDTNKLLSNGLIDENKTLDLRTSINNIIMAYEYGYNIRDIHNWINKCFEFNTIVINDNFMDDDIVLHNINIDKIIINKRGIIDKLDIYSCTINTLEFANNICIDTFIIRNNKINNINIVDNSEQGIFCTSIECKVFLSTLNIINNLNNFNISTRNIKELFIENRSNEYGILSNGINLDNLINIINNSYLDKLLLKRVYFDYLNTTNVKLIDENNNEMHKTSTIELSNLFRNNKVNVIIISCFIRHLICTRSNTYISQCMILDLNDIITNKVYSSLTEKL